MSKFMLFALVVLLATTLISAATKKTFQVPECEGGRHGDPCVTQSDCCPSLVCHRYANRCQVQITKEELLKQREKILGRRAKDYK